MKTIIFSGIVAFSLSLAGCALTPVAQRLKTDTEFQSAAKALTQGYLDGQKQGESGDEAAQKYGTANTFYNLVDYRIEGCGYEFGQPAVYFRVKAGNKMGGVTWEDYRVILRYDQKLEVSGDKYMGLRISTVGETLQESMNDSQ